jgi:hypothetical protein
VPGVSDQGGRTDPPTDLELLVLGTVIIAATINVAAGLIK